ncbi:MAG: hypothetical protein ACJ8BW_40585, partial [Ktedonobacteraceae bacterium]
MRRKPERSGASLSMDVIDRAKKHNPYLWSPNHCLETCPLAKGYLKEKSMHLSKRMIIELVSAPGIAHVNLNERMPTLEEMKLTDVENSNFMIVEIIQYGIEFNQHEIFVYDPNGLTIERYSYRLSSYHSNPKKK